MPNPVDLSAVDPAVDDRLDALEEGGGGGGASGTGHRAEYNNNTDTFEILVANTQDMAAADYEPGDGSFTPDEDNLVPAINTDGTFTFTTGALVLVKLYAEATFDDPPDDTDPAVKIAIAKGDASLMTLLFAGRDTSGLDTEATGEGNGVASTLTQSRWNLLVVAAGGTIGPVTITNDHATLTATFDAVNVELILL
jgi:hypothetical protein